MDAKKKRSKARHEAGATRPGSPETALLAIASLATRTADARNAADAIVSIMAQALGADHGLIALLNPVSGRLETEARHGTDPAGDTSQALAQEISEWVARHRRPALSADTAADPRYRALRPGVGSQMAAPLLAADGQVLGVVTLNRERGPAFGPDDLAQLTRLSAEASAVMRRLWELGRLLGTARQLETLVTAGQTLVSKLAPQELFDTLARDACELLQAKACALYLFEPKAATVRLAAYCGADGTSPAAGGMPIDSCLAAAAIHTRRPVTFADIRSPEFLDLADLPRGGGLRSVLAAPVACEGEVLGVLAVFLDRVHRFDNDEKRLCAALANLGAVAMQNARLYARVLQSEESLRKNERLTMLGLLSAEIAHEIRNPLTVLKLLHGGLGADFPEGDPRRKDMRVIAEKLDQLEAIVSRVLRFGKAPSSLRSRCSLADVVEDTLVFVRLKLVQGNISVRFNRPPRPLIVDGLKGQLQQALLNLIINATHAMPEGGTINLTLGAEGPDCSATLDVADTGTGIPEAMRERIFDSFLSGRPDGTGLGLAIAKRVLLSHNGDISLVATGPSGTTFRIRLPLAKA